MPKTLVLFYSRTGNTAALADAIADGARDVRFAEVDVRRLDDTTAVRAIAADATWHASRERLAARYRPLDSVDALATYDAIVIGAPARYGAMAAELKQFLDQVASLAASGALADKVGSAFTSTATPPDGRHHTVWSMLTPMADLGMIVVAPALDDAATESREGPNASHLAAARRLGTRVATVAEWVRHAKSHQHHHHG